ncbi:histidine kinase [Streptomyces sp. NPDC051214]|uniref:sensor histidine kinase n=1 Tax=Streptomyces sp. NPDC051214 TaxID=3155282 RepID=UPI00343969CD
MKSSWGRGALLWVALAIPAASAGPLGLSEPRPAWLQAAAATALALAVATRHYRPATAFAATAALGLATAPSLFTVSYGPALALFALLMGRRSTRVRPAALAFGATALIGTAKIVVRGVDPVVEWLVLMGTLLFGAVFPWLTGRYLRQARELSAAGWTRAAHLEREQRIVADRARLRERARIAQDMHDSLGHELSLIAVRAGALQVAADLPERHRTAAADLRAAASDATDRLHEIIGLLREEGDEAAPLGPAGESLRSLVERAADSGLPVRYTQAGEQRKRTEVKTIRPQPAQSAQSAQSAEPAESAEPTQSAQLAEPTHPAEPTQSAQLAQPTHPAQPTSSDEATARTLYRVVQEALTNAARHAPGAPVTVEVHETAVVVTNGASQRPGSGPGAGSGLSHLRARVEDLGGTFDAGPHAGGFRVEARLGPRLEARAEPRTKAPRPRPPHPTGPGRLAYARHRTLLAFGAALATGVLLVGGAFAWYAYSRSHAVLQPADFARLSLGQTQADAERLLPDLAASDPPAERAPTPPPEGADCRYYRASGELFVAVRHFRVCFKAGTLVEKSVIPKASARTATEHKHAKEWMA